MSTLPVVALALAVLLVGVALGSQLVIGASIALFLALAVERWAEVVREGRR